MLIGLAKTHTSKRIGNLCNVPFSLHRDGKTFPQNKKNDRKKGGFESPPFATLFNFMTKENLFVNTITTAAFLTHYCLPKQ